MSELDWERLGSELREWSHSCYGRPLHPAQAYQFLLEFPEYFYYASWPEGMPADPPLELIRAYLGEAT